MATFYEIIDEDIHYSTGVDLDDLIKTLTNLKEQANAQGITELRFALLTSTPTDVEGYAVFSKDLI